MASDKATDGFWGRRPAARFAWVVLGYFIAVVLWGAVVRATGSGGGCGNSWPLCNGYVNPLHHPRLATIIEFAHRQSTTVASALMAMLVLWTFRVARKGSLARKAALWTVFFLLLEALLGALLVLRHWVENNDSTGRVIAQGVHFTNTLLLMAALALTAWFLQLDQHQSSRTLSRSGLRTASWIAIGATIVVGASGALAALADTLFPSPTLAIGLAQDFARHAPTLVRMRWLHPGAALLGLGCALWMVGASVRGNGRWNGACRAVVCLLPLQFALGIADVLLLAPIWIQVLHLLGADLYWIALVLLAAEIVWPVEDAAAQPASAQAAVAAHAI